MPKEFDRKKTLERIRKVTGEAWGGDYYISPEAKKRPEMVADIIEILYAEGLSLHEAKEMLRGIEMILYLGAQMWH